MIGTAPPQARVLIVHQPGPWGPRGLLESRCDPDVARRIDAAAAKAGMRLQAVRRHGQHEIGVPAGGFHVGIAETRAEVPHIAWWRTNDLATIADALEAGSLPPPVEIDSDPLYLVCTHGKHDACCALRGRPLAHALQVARPGRVWETTHVGGDRFAANLLVLPGGELYGRVTPADAVHLADRVDAGDIVPELMRGRIGLTPIAQAALVYAHEQLALAKRTALAVTDVRRLTAELAHATVTTPGGAVVVAVALETSDAAQLTCRGPQRARANVYRGVAIIDAAGTAVLP